MGNLCKNIKSWGIFVNKFNFPLNFLKDIKWT